MFRGVFLLPGIEQLYSKECRTKEWYACLKIYRPMYNFDDRIWILNKRTHGILHQTQSQKCYLIILINLHPQYPANCLYIVILINVLLYFCCCMSWSMWLISQFWLGVDLHENMYWLYAYVTLIISSSDYYHK